MPQSLTPTFKIGYEYKLLFEFVLTNASRNLLFIYPSIYLGDHTLSATVLAINELGLTTDQHDESIVIVLSDANFDRYGIRPEYFGKILNRLELYILFF